MKKSKICLKVLLVLLFLFLTTICNATTYYVATNGDNTDGSTWEKAYQTIQAAVTAASNTDFIIVGSSGGDHGTGTYTEKIDVNKQLTIQSESGYSTTTVIAEETHYIVFEIASDDPSTTTLYNVTIDGFTIYGASNSGVSGILLNNTKDCLIQNNRCGYSGSYNGYGVRLYNSNRNAVLNNIIDNGSSSVSIGIFLDNSFRNTISNNEIKNNGSQAGIRSYYSGTIFNTISENTITDNLTGIDLSASRWNMILKNTIQGNSTGIRLVSVSNGNRIYLNSFENTSNATTSCSNIWRPGLDYEKTLLSFFYSSNNSKTCMGNYWDDYTATSSSNGIGTDPSYTPGSDIGDDIRPLIYDIDNYEILAWYLHNDDVMYKDSPNKIPHTVEITGGSSNRWIADEAAQVDLTFPSGKWCGQICIVDANGHGPANGDTFTLEIGSWDGSTFTSCVTATITGTGTTTDIAYEFQTDQAALSIDTGEYLAMEITNNNASKTNYGIWTGGAWSWISSPGNGDPNYSLPVELSAFTAQYIMNTPTLYWSTQTETDNLGWYIYRNTESDFTSADKISGLIPGHGTTSQPQDYIYEDIDELEVDQTYYYWLESVDFGGTINHFDRMVSITIPIHEDPHQNITPPQVRELRANPNPFTQSTNINFILNETSMAEVSIYNIKGEKVRSYPSQHVTAEEIVSLNWNGKDDNDKNLPVGIYLYKLVVNGSTRDTKRIILMR